MKKKVLITGASRGIGKAIYDSFDKDVYDVVGISTKDVNFWDTVPFLDFLRELNDVDILVNNAGINIIKPFGDVLPWEFERIMSINLRAPFFLSQKVRENGVIINISSIQAAKPLGPGRTLYCATKAALEGFSRALEKDLAEKNIKVHIIRPGVTDTDLTRQSLTAERIAELEANGQLGRPEDIAKQVQALL